MKLSLCSATVFAILSVPLSAQHQVASDPSSHATKAAEAVLTRRVSLTVRSVGLHAAIDAVAAAAHVQVQYQLETLQPYEHPVTVQLRDMPLGTAFEMLFNGTRLRIVPIPGGRLSVVEDRSEVERASGGIAGTVLDAETKRPVRGATVLLDEAAHGVLTGDDGAFRLADVSAGEHRVTVRLIGYGRLVKMVTVSDGQITPLEVLLSHTVNTLDQMVVTGTVIPTELKAVPNAITVVTAKDIERRGITQLPQLFRGDVPGLFAPNQGSISPLDETVMYSRGATALSGSSQGTSATLSIQFYTNPIKTYIDGVEMADPKYLSQIDPKSIERIEILTGPQASTIYGSNAINGVMQIFTKRGTSNTPQLTLNLLSGWVESNFNNAYTPQHDDNAQVSGAEGHVSYNAGTTWNYIGAWTPAKQTDRRSAYGGARFDFSTRAGRITADVTVRRNWTQNKQLGSEEQQYTDYRGTGWFAIYPYRGLTTPTVYTLKGQTVGLVLGYSMTTWWSHEFGLGQDLSESEQRVIARAYRFPGDTTLTLIQNSTERPSLRYTTTMQASLTSQVHTTVTLGADAWQKLTSLWFVTPQTLTGTLSGNTSITRQPDHNTGAFGQTQLGLYDRVFFTYGLRAEWNPAYGLAAQPNYAPRYGVAYTQDLGSVTAKLRASGGRSTRPPVPAYKTGITLLQYFSGAIPLSVASYYPPYLQTLANPDLAPEYQQGSEGGLEVYWGARGSLVVTRYNQTVQGLIEHPVVDSVRTLVPCPIGICGASSLDTAGYGYRYQYQYLNIGSIRNQGWELQGSLNTGPFTTRGTYSWTKSRTIGVAPKYRALFPASAYPQYQPGATFQFLPEHTWALGVTYAHAGTTVGINTTGTGKVANWQSDFYLHNLDGNLRLRQNNLHIGAFGNFVSMNNAYALANLTASHRLATQMDGVIQIQNLMNQYTNDFWAVYATMGRQVKAGLRIRL